ncbi:nucleoid occlusion factor SlmA [Parasulfuritortus cantonensis]|uniref:Nucleoid occlusion factor SlmA n=2 Tax=Parasulfuritortus cantonensis TaxID=2528202 RepID=A0A4V6NAX9_9PROT|nr:nucleoid occlusion factor SlmA [Parasulfuritortus cantonensis]
MLEAPQAEKITTAALAARLGVSEAALYRHFASKAQMYEGLIEFIETTLFGLINRIGADEAAGAESVLAMAKVLLAFAEKNRGMCRVLTGEVLVNENPRLQARVNQLLDRIEVSLKQAVRIAAGRGGLAADLDAGAAANLVLAWVQGRWQQFVKSGFARVPTEQLVAQWGLLARAFSASTPGSPGPSSA